MYTRSHCLHFCNERSRFLFKSMRYTCIVFQIPCFEKYKVLTPEQCTKYTVKFHMTKPDTICYFTLKSLVLRQKINPTSNIVTQSLSLIGSSKPKPSCHWARRAHKGQAKSSNLTRTNAAFLRDSEILLLLRILQNAPYSSSSFTNTP